MTEWEPGLYEAFREARHRPLVDLLAHVPRTAGLVVDAGCGTGRTTHDIASRLRKAQVIGVDASEHMIALARGNERVSFVHADVDAWEPPEPVGLVVSNAMLHWLPDPRRTLQHMARWLVPGGTLAFQVPANFDAPSHIIARDTAAAHGCPPSPAQPIGLQGPPQWLGADWSWDIWQTTYLHDLPGEDAVLRWLSGTTLRPYLGRGKDVDQAFLADLARRLRAAYPPEEGRVRLPFTRRFWVASRAAT